LTFSTTTPVLSASHDDTTIHCPCRYVPAYLLCCLAFTPGTRCQRHRQRQCHPKSQPLGLRLDVHRLLRSLILVLFRLFLLQCALFFPLLPTTRALELVVKASLAYSPLIAFFSLTFHSNLVYPCPQTTIQAGHFSRPLG
jgi:hypothetical protein